MTREQFEQLRAEVQKRVLVGPAADVAFYARVDAALRGFAEVIRELEKLVERIEIAERAAAAPEAMGKARPGELCATCGKPAVFIDRKAAPTCGPCFRKHRREDADA